MRTILITAAAVTALAGCGSGGGDGGRVRVVAAENVYGEIAREIGGSHVEATSILSDPNADPHLFQPGTRTGLAVARAQVVIQNGLGYDTFIDALERAAPAKHRIVVDVADVLDASGNPHLWYDLPQLPRVAAAIANALSTADPVHARDYARGRAAFVRRVQTLVRSLASWPRGAAVASTEPIGDYLLAAGHVRDVAPDAFTHAIEQGTEPPPAAVSSMLALLGERRVRALVYNEQAVSPITKRIRDAAVRAGIPVVGFTETMPPGATFFSWQEGQIDRLANGLRR